MTEVIGKFRFVLPYEYCYVTHAKGRWFGRCIVDVFLEEFSIFSREEIIKKINSNQIKVNSSSTTLNYIIKDNDIIEHTMIRTEYPVFNLEPKIIGETDNFIGFLKPPSIPVHPTGSYNINSLTKMLGDLYFPLHRLDRLTSGIIVMAKTKNAAIEFQELQDLTKKYVARVKGRFPDGEIVVDQPIAPFKKNLVHVDPSGKKSITKFTLIRTNGTESIVECQPITGRMHQIRAHLAFIGYPISNDSVYGGDECAAEDLDDLNKGKEKGYVQFDFENRTMHFMIFLHSFRYQCKYFDFSADMPEWSNI